MAEVNAFVTPDAILRPEAQTAADRAPERLAEQQRAAENALGGFDEWLGAADVGGNMFESEFEERIVDRVPFVMRNRIRGRIFDVLGAAGLDHQNSLGGSEFSALEQHTWALTRNTTLDAIRNRGRGANTSLLAAEGFGNLLSTSLGGFETEWQAQKQLAQDAFAQFTWWDKVSTLGRKKRFEKFSKKFEEKLKQEKERINVSIKTITQRKKMDVHRAENRVKLVFSRATETEQEGIWRRIRAAIQNPAANVAASLADFTPPAMAQPDFLHALTNLEYADGVVRSRRSEELNLDANRKLEDLRNRETIMLTPADYGQLRTDLQALAVNPAEGAAFSTEKMAAEMETAMQRIPNINFTRNVYLGRNINEITSAEKMAYFVSYLNANAGDLQSLHRDVRKNLLKYINQLDQDTRSDFENTTLANDLDADFQGVQDGFSAVAGIGGLLPNNLRTLSATLTVNAFDQDTFNGVVSSLDEAVDGFSRQFRRFERRKSELQTADRERLENVWAELKEARQKIEEIVNIWKEEVKKFQELQAPLPSAVAAGRGPVVGIVNIANDWDTHLTDEITRLGGLRTTASTTAAGQPGGAGGGPIAGPSGAQLAAEINALDRQIREAEQQRTQIRSSRDKLTRFTFTNPTAFGTDIAGIGAIVLPPAARPAVAPAPTLNERIHERITTEFYEQVEKDYLSFLEKNTTEQFDLLRKIPTGARIKLTFRDSTNVSTLQVPQDLEQNRTEVGAGAARLRVIRNTAEGVMLESSTHIYVINGPSAKDGKANSNIGVYRKTRVNAAGNPINSNGLGVPPNAGPDFNIAHSNPNTTGIILSMRIQ